MKKIYLLIFTVLVSSAVLSKSKESNNIPKYKNSAVFSHSIIVPLKQAESFDFILKEFGAINNYIESIEGRSIIQDCHIDEIIDSEQILYVSTPSISKVELKNKSLEEKGNTFVYWSFEQLSAEKTKIQITVIVQFSSSLERFKLGFAGVMKPWKRNCIEEMEGLRVLMLNQVNT